MGKPRLIILIRHAQSEGNKNRDIHQTMPDHRVKLTSDGWQQAYDAGRRLRKLLRADDTLHFFTSPYRRTRETTEGILATLTSDEPEPSPFKRNNIKVYEEPRLREQDFGNFQPCSAEMERMWQERADYGHFFYRIPNGESAADAYDRVSGFNESLWRQFGEDDFASVCVLVTHGLMSRVFLMKWYHFSVEYFEDLRNVNHCEFLIMRKNEDSGKYILQNKLRTWSELKRERAMLQAKEKGDREEKGDRSEKGEGNSKDSSTLVRAFSQTTLTAPPVEKRRWGGCPNGCNHDKSFKIRQNLADLVKSDSITFDAPAAAGAAKNGSVAATGTRGGESTPEGTMTVHKDASENPSFNGTANSHTVSSGSQVSTIVSRRPAAKRFHSHSNDNDSGSSGPAPVQVVSGPQIDVTRAREEVVSSPDGTPSFISVDDRLRGHLKSPMAPAHVLHHAGRPLDHAHILQLHIGRDFGGTYSGHSSAVPSDADSSEDDDHRRRRARMNQDVTSGGSNATPNSSDANSIAESVKKVNSSGNGSGLHHSHHGHHNHHVSRDQSRMGHRIRANRLGDHPHSSDGEHEADGEHEHDDHSHGHGQSDEDDEEVEKDGSSEENELSRTLTDEADDALLRRAEREDRSIQGSVY